MKITQEEWNYVERCAQDALPKVIAKGCDPQAAAEEAWNYAFAMLERRGKRLDREYLEIVREIEPEYGCANCGSPRWESGGMGSAFRKCMDCGAIGVMIEKRDAS